MKTRGRRQRFLPWPASDRSPPRSPPLFNQQLIHITPAPTFRWFSRADDGMAGRVKVLRGVFVLRRSAAPDVATGEAHSQMDPAVLHFQTLFAASGARLDVADLVEMGAGLLGHDHTSLRYSCTN